METSAVNSNEKKTKPKTTRILPTKTTILIVAREALTPAINSRTMPMQTNTINQKDRKSRPVYPTWEEQLLKRSLNNSYTSKCPPT